MRAERLRAYVEDDHSLTLQLPPEVPSGDVDVLVLYSELPGVITEPETPSKPKTLEEFDAWLAQQPAIDRSPDEIVREIAEERASWD
ncbi:hypothetical protein [Thiorhodovibrio frisius]|uniref:Addiction module component n=1 Tax=Thiorhodovibrio frisius TaxID=631362 RepID=H8Z1Z3_9GAMM|nr:hypothetical protein [Thiorhodovibrio frisius]EIC21518.1 hypothetical protein Thi970DRAFT_01730 [Thiorhodovibrio frisius]WPL24102.1 hypothetical protein Thiofri_04314 [Thiorhodovibrio frisius]